MANKKYNMDFSSGDIFPVNSKIQGETFEQISHFINPRSGQLIKKVSYEFKVEYYPEDDASLGGSE